MWPFYSLLLFIHRTSTDKHKYRAKKHFKVLQKNKLKTNESNILHMKESEILNRK